MKTPQPINFPDGGTPAERLDRAFRRVLTVSKEELLKEESAENQAKARRKPRKKAAH